MGNNAGARGSSALCTYYALRRRDESVGIYASWEEVEKNIRGQAGLTMMTFESWDDANEWMRTPLAGVLTRRRKRKRTSSTSCTSSHRARSSRFVPETSEDEESANASSKSEGAALSTSSVRDQDVSSPPCPILLDGSSSSLMPTPPASADSLLPVSEEGTLSPEQQAVFDKVKAGHSLFFTGAAGTGKSYLLRKIVKWARETRRGHQVAVTASTGTAAINIGGCTIYSWAGIGLGKEEPEALYKIITNKSYGKHEKTGQKYLRRDSALMHWKTCEILILDEVSMIDGKLIDKLDWLGRHIRHKNKPWGGIQVIYCGDFFQLPPVSENEDGIKIPPTMAFESESWSNTVGKPIALKKVFRQDDLEFVDMLNALRVGQLNEHHVRKFKELDRDIHCPEGLEPVQLYPKKDKVGQANTERLAKLPGEARPFVAIDEAGWTKRGDRFPAYIVEPALNRMVALEKVELKVGAQVMLIKNLVDGHLVNGSLGRVIDFRRARDALKEDIDFGLPQCLNEWSKDGGKAKRADPPDRLFKDDENEYWPLVEFAKSGKRVLCVRTDFEAVSASGQVQATRSQIPLILAWAMSIHKSQGMTIDYLQVDLAESFEFGQVYVALSRARSREGLRVCNFDPLGVKTHPRVIEWMKTVLEEGEE